MKRMRRRCMVAHLVKPSSSIRSVTLFSFASGVSERGKRNLELYVKFSCTVNDPVKRSKLANRDRVRLTSGSREATTVITCCISNHSPSIPYKESSCITYEHIFLYRDAVGFMPFTVMVPSPFTPLFNLNESAFNIVLFPITPMSYANAHLKLMATTNLLH